MSVVVKVGLQSSYEFFFEVASPNYQSFEREPSTLTVMNAAMALWHMHEWDFNDDPSVSHLNNKQYREQLDNHLDTNLLIACPELVWLKDVAEAGKHYRLHRKTKPVKVQEVNLKRDLSSGFFIPGITPAGVMGDEYSYELVAEGQKHDLHYVMRKVYHYWLGKVLLYQVIYSIPKSDNDVEVHNRLTNWCYQKLGNEQTVRQKWSHSCACSSPNYHGIFIFLDESTAQEFKEFCRLNNVDVLA